jgi:hypothetical protein
MDCREAGGEMPVRDRLVFAPTDSQLKVVLRTLIGFNADPDPDFYLNADPDPGSKINADSDPGRLRRHKKLDFDMKNT